MRTHARNAFTLVEILIVVVILGILAAIVVPQFTSASQDAIKGALSSQLQTISAQVELYRVQNAGDLPHNDADSPLGTDGGWGVLVEDNFLKDEPNNGFTQSTAVTTGTSVPAYTDPPESNDGWAYDTDSGTVVAIGFNQELNLLGNETDYADPTFD